MEGTVIGNYRVVRKLTEGGMGTVYEAVHDRLGKRAALKTLHPEFARRPEFVQRLIDEARAVSLVDHPGLVEVFDCGLDENGTAYILMEYLNGETLGARLKALHGRGRLDLSVTLRISRQIASALSATHEKGIVHRDLKPDNVMLVADPEAPGGERAKLLDFGIAKLRAELNESEDTRHVTMAGTLMGTPTFMSPEQCRGAGQVDDRTDVYSLGIMLYLMVGGRPPFIADGPGEVMLMHMTQQPAPLSSLAPEAPLELLSLVHQMLQKERGDRLSMAEASLRLTQLCEALDWGGTTGAYVKLSGAPSPGGPASSRAQAGMRPTGPGLHPSVPQAAVWNGPSQVHPGSGALPARGPAPTPGYSPQYSSSETSFSRGSLHPMAYSTGGHSLPPVGARRRWFVGVAIVTGFVVAAPLWWLIDQREQNEQAQREQGALKDPPRKAPSDSPRGADRLASPSASPRPSDEGTAAVPTSPTTPATEKATAEPAGGPKTPALDSDSRTSDSRSADGTTTPRRRSDRPSAPSATGSGDGATEASRPAEPAVADNKSARSTRRANKKSDADELLDLLDQRAKPSDSRGPATDKAKPRSASPARANAKEKAHVDPSLF